MLNCGFKSCRFEAYYSPLLKKLVKHQPITPKLTNIDTQLLSLFFALSILRGPYYLYKHYPHKTLCVYSFLMNYYIIPSTILLYNPLTDDFDKKTLLVVLAKKKRKVFFTIINLHRCRVKLSFSTTSFLRNHSKKKPNIKMTMYKIKTLFYRILINTKLIIFFKDFNTIANSLFFKLFDQLPFEYLVVLKKRGTLFLKTRRRLKRRITRKINKRFSEYKLTEYLKKQTKN